ncbi:MAG: hypothetical protein EHM21_12140 [Chloroflexi bacterium]|nr:MAG: hypothetical protein EHM21_12140 [Chloroflexota bacterium]
MVKRLYDSSQWIAAGLMMFLLPFTSFPLVARLTGSQMVAPLSFLPMLILLAIWLVPFLLRSGKFPGQVVPLLAFLAVVLISAAAAFFMPFPVYKGATLLRSEFKALATLLVGSCFYLVITGWAHQAARIRFLLRWINWGGVLLLSWALFQAAVWFRLHTYPDWMWTFQGQTATSLLLYGPRSNGFAYEPSWLSHQLNMLYLPFWTACVVTGFTAHRFRLGKLHFEHLLLLGGVAVLGLSVSRIGWLTFLAMLAFLMLFWNVRLVSWLQRRLFRNQSEDGGKTRLLRIGFIAASALVLCLVYAGLLYGAGYALSRVDPRMAKIFDFATIREQSLFHWANQNVFAERIVFWQVGWEIFNDYPIMGVGLGNAGYFFPQKLSAFSLALTEVRTLMFKWTMLPNIKSLWVRLLAETGVIGFGLFLCWGYVLWQSAWFLRAWKDPFFRMVGLAGGLVLVGFIVEGFSLDTFALPYYWFSFGLLTAA